MTLPECIAANPPRTLTLRVVHAGAVEATPANADRPGDASALAVRLPSAVSEDRAILALPQQETVGAASAYYPCYLGDETPAYEGWCRSLAEQGKFQRYELEPFGKFIKVGPKCEWFTKDVRGWRSKYGWGQSPRFYQAGYPMEDEPMVLALAERIEPEFGEKVPSPHTPP